MKNISLLGSTGSIGTQALEVCRRDGYKVVALAAGSNIDLLEAQAREFKVKAVAVFNEEKANELKIKLSDTDIKVLSGVEGVCSVAEMEADIALNSIVGIAGLRPTLAAIESGKDIALANKERLPEYVGLNLQSSGEFAMMVNRNYAVYGPLCVTGFCLLLMFLSRKSMYPWIISLFSLVLPVLLLVTNLYPA